jgi:hypothetical protein
LKHRLLALIPGERRLCLLPSERREDQQGESSFTCLSLSLIENELQHVNLAAEAVLEFVLDGGFDAVQPREEILAASGAGVHEPQTGINMSITTYVHILSLSLWH